MRRIKNIWKKLVKINNFVVYYAWGDYFQRKFR
jgi:hypothetical protein